jgi:hypothetical protein
MSDTVTFTFSKDEVETLCHALEVWFDEYGRVGDSPNWDAKKMDAVRTKLIEVMGDLNMK